MIKDSNKDVARNYLCYKLKRILLDFIQSLSLDVVKNGIDYKITERV